MGLRLVHILRLIHISLFLFAHFPPPQLPKKYTFIVEATEHIRKKFKRKQ